jgi:hypothetical protein
VAFVQRVQAALVRNYRQLEHKTQFSGLQSERRLDCLLSAGCEHVCTRSVSQGWRQRLTIKRYPVRSVPPLYLASHISCRQTIGVQHHNSTCGCHCTTTVTCCLFNANSRASRAVRIHHKGPEHDEVILAAVPTDYWRCNSCTGDSRPPLPRSSGSGGEH